MLTLFLALGIQKWTVYTKSLPQWASIPVVWMNGQIRCLSGGAVCSREWQSRQRDGWGQGRAQPFSYLPVLSAGRVRGYFHLFPKPSSATHQPLMSMFMWFIFKMRLWTCGGQKRCFANGRWPAGTYFSLTPNSTNCLSADFIYLESLWIIVVDT